MRINVLNGYAVHQTYFWFMSPTRRLAVWHVEKIYQTYHSERSAERGFTAVSYSLFPKVSNFEAERKDFSKCIYVTEGEGDKTLLLSFYTRIANEVS